MKPAANGCYHESLKSWPHVEPFSSVLRGGGGGGGGGVALKLFVIFLFRPMPMAFHFPIIDPKKYQQNTGSYWSNNQPDGNPARCYSSTDTGLEEGPSQPTKGSSLYQRLPLPVNSRLSVSCCVYPCFQTQTFGRGGGGGGGGLHYTTVGPTQPSTWSSLYQLLPLPIKSAWCVMLCSSLFSDTNSGRGVGGGCKLDLPSLCQIPPTPCQL